MFRYTIINKIALWILLVLSSNNSIYLLFAQPNCEIYPASKLVLKFFCDSLVRGSTNQYTYQRVNEKGAIVYFINVEYANVNISSSDSVFSFLKQQFNQPWNNFVFTPKTSSSNFLSSNRLFKFHVKGVAEKNDASYIREMIYVKTLKNALLFDFIYVSGSSYRRWNDDIIQSIKDNQDIDFTNEELNFRIKTSIPYLKIQQDLLDNYLKRIIILITLNGLSDEENYKTNPYLIIQDITHKPLALSHIHDSLKKQIEINPITQLVDFGIKKDIPLQLNVQEVYFLRYKTKLIDRLHIVGDQQVEEWLVETDKGIKLQIGFFFPCEMGLADCFQENPIYYKVFESLLKDIYIK